MKLKVKTRIKDWEWKTHITQVSNTVTLTVTPWRWRLYMDTITACITIIVQIMASIVDSNFIPTFYISTKKVESKYNLCRFSLKSSTTATSLLPGGIRGNGGAIFNTSNLHASSGQRSQGRLRSGSGGLGPVSSGGSQLDVKGSDAQSFDLRFKIMLNLTNRQQGNIKLL